MCLKAESVISCGCAKSEREKLAAPGIEPTTSPSSCSRHVQEIHFHNKGIVT